MAAVKHLDLVTLPTWIQHNYSMEDVIILTRSSEDRFQVLSTPMTGKTCQDMLCIAIHLNMAEAQQNRECENE